MPKKHLKKRYYICSLKLNKGIRNENNIQDFVLREQRQNRKYSPCIRSWQIAPLLTAIEDSYEAKIQRRNRILTVWGGIVSLLSIFCVIVLFILFRQRKQLKAARQQLEDANKHLVKTNDKQKWMNDRVNKSNAEWQAENKRLKERLDTKDSL